MEYVNEENLFKRDETRKEVRDKRKFTDPISHISLVIFEKAGITSIRPSKNWSSKFMRVAISPTGKYRISVHSPSPSLSLSLSLSLSSVSRSPHDLSVFAPSFLYTRAD